MPTPRPKAATLAAAALALTALPVLAGCGASDRPAGPSATTFAEARFDPGAFATRTGANRWLPLVPGTQWVRDGATDVGNRRVPHRVVSTVTDVHRTVHGVRTVIVLDRGIDAGQTAHQSIDYFAEDRRGNVWSMGSYTEAYEAGRFVSVRDAWLAGVDGSRPGILMPADPRPGTRGWSISQPKGEDPDAAEAVQAGLRRCIPFRCFDDVLVVREGKASALDNELKYYAPGVGQIDNVPRSASRHRDVERLVNLVRLTPGGLAEASAEALRLDRHARNTRPAVFALAPPAARRP